LTAYGTIGLIFGLVGKGFFMAGIQQNLSIFIGIAMIAVILIPKDIRKV
jgi:sulfite exporter TauE/SafE